MYYVFEQLKSLFKSLFGFIRRNLARILTLTLLTASITLTVVTVLSPKVTSSADVEVHIVKEKNVCIIQILNDGKIIAHSESLSGGKCTVSISSTSSDSVE
jgi:hypothetical protein